ncbi:MAG: hypothetical protein H7A45_05190 [Verrucomicrobiales bacterium]|nr:hypothetical protein [Verrucomicrobiales bacterium]MCP5524867.1 hypothetical protein [Verrucomicrobiales bacterium]
MKTRNTDPTRSAFLTSASLALLIGLTRMAAPMAHAQDLDLRVVGGYDTGGAVYDVVMAGNHAYVATSSGLQVIDMSEPSDPRQEGICSTIGHAWGVVISGSYAFVACLEGGLQVVDISNPAIPQRVGGYITGGFSRSVAVSGNHAFVAVEDSDLQVLDISDPLNPQRVGGYGVSSGAIAVSGNHAYVLTVGSELQVLDISNPANPRRVSIMGGVEGSLAIQGEHAYVAGSLQDGEGMHAGLKVIDISAPANPHEVGRYNASGYDVHDVFVSGNHAYLTENAANPASRLIVVDVSDSGNPRQVGSYDTDFGFYGADVAVSGNYAYVASGREQSSHQVIDISDPTSPRGVGSYQTSTSLDLAVAGDHAYVTTWSGLQVFDISHPASPQPVGAYDTSSDTHEWFTRRVAVSGNYACVAETWWDQGQSYTDQQGRLEVIDVKDPANPRRVGGYDTSGGARAVAMSGSHAYVAETWYDQEAQTSKGLVEVIDLSDPANLRLVSRYETKGAANDVTVAGTYAYVAGGRFDETAGHHQDGLTILDISNPANLQRVGSYDLAGLAIGVTVSGEHAYTTDIWEGLRVLDVSDPTNPSLVGGSQAPVGYVGYPAISGEIVFVGAPNVLAFDISDPANPRQSGISDLIGPVWGDSDERRHDGHVAVSGGYAYVAGITAGLKVIEISPATELRIGPAMMEADGSIRLPVNGKCGQRVRLQRSDNLVDWEDWQTMILGGDGCGLIDTTTATPARFYRAVNDITPAAD